MVQAYDSHCNLVLGEVEETIYTVDEEEEGGNGEVRTVKKQSEMLFVRGMWICLGLCAGLPTGLTRSTQATRLSSFRRSNERSQAGMARNTIRDYEDRFLQDRRIRSKIGLLGHMHEALVKAQDERR